MKTTSLLVVCCWLVSGWPSNAVAKTFTVTSADDTEDRGSPRYAGTLREAIELANLTPGPDEIVFDIQGQGVHTIHLQAALPVITGPVVIDASTQSSSSSAWTGDGESTQYDVELDCTDVNDRYILLFASVNDCEVKGLVIHSVRRTPETDAILVSDSDRIVISRNIIGMRPDGTKASPLDPDDPLGRGDYEPRGLIGVLVVNGSSRATIDHNVIGSGYAGIFIDNGAGGRHTIRDNRIGTDPTGTSQSSPDGLPGNRDLGVGHTGILIWGGAGDDNWIEGNVIGGDGRGRRIGGVGMFVLTRGNTIRGNSIGTDETGTRDFGHGHVGLVTGFTGIDSDSVNLVEGNTIAFNGASPETVWDLDHLWDGHARAGIVAASTKGCRFVSNHIYANQGLWEDPITGKQVLGLGIGIDLTTRFTFVGPVRWVPPGFPWLDWPYDNHFAQNDGPTPNDPGDVDGDGPAQVLFDEGANGLQNYPVLTAEREDEDAVVVHGVLNSKAHKSYTIQLFSSLEAAVILDGRKLPRPNGRPDAGERFLLAQGRDLLGTQVVQTDASGVATFTMQLRHVRGRFLTATATGDEGTSELSEAVDIGSRR